MRKFLSTLMLAAGCAFQPAHSGVLEDLLAMPAIQSLLGRLPELAPLVRNCENVAYRQSNPTLCQQVAQAAQLARMPLELRAVMASPPAAASLRELCLAAIGRPAYNGFLCTELNKFDETFQGQLQQKQQDDIQNRQMR